MRVSAALDAPTLPRLLAARVAATPHASAFVERDASGAWTPLAWSAFAGRVDALARALVAAGLRPGHRVGIAAPTSVAWETVQMAVLAAGGVAVGLDPHYADDALDAAAAQARLHALVVEDDAALERFGSEVLGTLALTLRLRGDGSGSLAALVARHAAHAAALPVAAPHDGALVTYSSGTTGTPRPVLYTHEQVRIAVRAIVTAFPDIGAQTRLLCWLPLANLFQRVLDFCALAAGATSYVVGDPRRAMIEAAAVHPDIMIGVPRFFERVQVEVEAQLARQSRLARWTFARALAVGLERTPATPLQRLARGAADRFVFRRVRAAFGSAAQLLVSGSAPMPRWLLDWYEAVGLPVYEAYGVSEDIVPVALNRPGARRRGSAGRVLAPNEVRLDADGEVSVRGPGVFEGYLFAAPDAPAPDADGWWRTGDLAVLDADGFLAVTGRKGDAFKDSGGRWILPQRAEHALRRLPYVREAAVGGADRPAAAAVLDLLQGEAPDDARIAADVRAATAMLAAHERPAVVVVAATPFSVAGGELTANLKLRRGAVFARHAAALDAAFAALAADGARDRMPPVVRAPLHG
jgi:long-chain acyl-CoA synthetase